MGQHREETSYSFPLELQPTAIQAAWGCGAFVLPSEDGTITTLVQSDRGTELRQAMESVLRGNAPVVESSGNDVPPVPAD